MQVFESCFDVKQENMSQYQEIISKWCSDNDVEEELLKKILVCADEITSNIVFYSGATQLKITMEKKNDSVFVTFMDNGKAFNPLVDAKEPDTTLPIEDRKIGGLGIFMVKKMMDYVEYSRTGEANCLKIGSLLTKV